MLKIKNLALVCVTLFTAAAKSDGPTKLISADLLAASKSSDWRAVKNENLIYLELASGRVIIELNPEYAPQHVANIVKLAHENYWDGLAVVRVQDNYVVQWADPNSENPKLKRPLKKAKATLTAEFDRTIDAKIPFNTLPDRDVYAPETGFSNGFAAARDNPSKKTWLLHCYGAIGAGRDEGADSGGGTELYAVIGQAPRHLDRNVTVVGRVLQGMEFLSSLPRGHASMGFYEKPEMNVPILRVRWAMDMPAKDRVKLEVLRTDTPLFEQLIKARQNRQESWFKYQAGHIDACNMTVPVREAKSTH